MERILLIEDDQALGRGTALALAGEGREMPSPLTVFGALNLNARNFDE